MKTMSPTLSRLFALVKPLLGGGSLVAASFIANFLNFFFNAYLGRNLDFENFAAISLVGSFSYLSTLISKGFGTTVTYQIAYFVGQKDPHAAAAYWKYIRRYAFIFSLAIVAIWMLLSPAMSAYFNTDDIFLFILFSLVFLVGFSLTVDQSFLTGRLMFSLVAIVILVESVMKNLLAFAYVTFGLQQYAYSIVPLATLATFLVGWLMVRFVIRRDKLSSHTKKSYDFSFPAKFFSVSMLLGLSSLAFLSFDVILVKHFLSPVEAGQYALISLVGKMIYFFAGLASVFILPLTSRNEGAKSDSRLVFYLSLAATCLLSIAVYIPLGPLSHIFVPILYGQKALVITPYLTTFCLGIVCFSISKIFISYYLVKKIYLFALASFSLTLLQIGLMSTFHDNIQQIVSIMAGVGVANLFTVWMLHTFGHFTQRVENKAKHFVRQGTTSLYRSYLSSRAVGKSKA